MSLHEAMKKAGVRICPSCGKEYEGHSAISRKDNKTEICPSCGTWEALMDFKKAKEQGLI